MKSNIVVDTLYKEFQGKLQGLVKALTVDQEKVIKYCDPTKDDVCLYGKPDGNWSVDSPVEMIPPDLPEPCIGINYIRDDMDRFEWIQMVAQHSESWLMSSTYHCGARLNKEDRWKLFNLINQNVLVYQRVRNYLALTYNQKYTLSQKRDILNSMQINNKSLNLDQQQLKKKRKKRQDSDEDEDNENDHDIVNNNFNPNNYNSNNYPANDLNQNNNLINNLSNKDNNNNNNNYIGNNIITNSNNDNINYNNLFVNNTVNNNLNNNNINDSINNLHNINIVNSNFNNFSSHNNYQNNTNENLQTHEQAPGVEPWDDGDGEPCPICRRPYQKEEFWIACDFCDTWYCGRCAKMTDAKAEKLGTWKCQNCTEKLEKQ